MKKDETKKPIWVNVGGIPILITVKDKNKIPALVKTVSNLK